MNTPNKRFIKYHTDPPSPKQAWKFESLAGIGLPDDIRTKGGAGLAIGTLISAKDFGTKVADVLLPGVCFVTDFSPTGVPKIATIVDKKYLNGITIAQLRAAGSSLAKVAKVRAAQPDTVTVKRHTISEASIPDSFNDVLVVRRVR